MALLAPAASSAGAAPEGPAEVGRFDQPFQEPGEKCVEDAAGRSECKPAASIAMLPNGEIVYWDSLEGMEDVESSVVAEYGDKAGNNPSRVLDLRGRTPSWRTPTPEDGGANPRGNDEDAEYLPGVPHDNDYKDNDGDMFCADQVFLSDGRVLVAGGTSYYLEPGSGGLGVTELEGLRNSRTFDPATSRWEQSGSMTYGRWYPSLVTLGDGRVFVASGVTKLIKPVYADRPQDSGTNVKQSAHPFPPPWRARSPRTPRARRPRSSPRAAAAPVGTPPSPPRPRPLPLPGCCRRPAGRSRRSGSRPSWPACSRSGCSAGAATPRAEPA